MQNTIHEITAAVLIAFCLGICNNIKRISFSANNRKNVSANNYDKKHILKQIQENNQYHTVNDESSSYIFID